MAGEGLKWVTCGAGICMDGIDCLAVVVLLAVVVWLWDTVHTKSVAGSVLASSVVEKRVCWNSETRISRVLGERSLCAKVRYFSRRV